MNIQLYSISWIDHPFFVVFAVLYPLYGFISYRRNLARLESGELSRSEEYIYTAGFQWILFVIGIVIWQSQSRDWSTLGLGTSIEPLWRFALAIALVLLALGLLGAQLRTVRNADAAAREKLDAEYAGVIPIMPHSLAELRNFYILSVTAGIVEELLWRGFMIWYLSHAMPLWAAAIVSAVFFGVAHAYQGRAQVPRIALIGLVFSGLYLLSGSLWLPMILHALMDMIMGRASYEYLTSRQQDQ